MSFDKLARLPLCKSDLTLWGCSLYSKHLYVGGANQYVVWTRVSCHHWRKAEATMINQDELCSGYHIPSRSNEFVRAAIIIALITYPMVLLRFISRIYIARRVWWDDWFILLATVGGPKWKFKGFLLTIYQMGMIANTIVPSYRKTLRYHVLTVPVDW